MHLLVCAHGRSRVLLGIVRGSVLGALRECEDEDGSEPPGHPAQQARPDAGSRQSRRFCAQQIEPVLLVATLGIGEAEQDLALLARATVRELLVDEPFGAFLHEVARPAATVCGGRLGGSGGCHEVS